MKEKTIKELFDEYYTPSTIYSKVDKTERFKVGATIIQLRQLTRIADELKRMNDQEEARCKIQPK